MWMQFTQNMSYKQVYFLGLFLTCDTWSKIRNINIDIIWFHTYIYMLIQVEPGKPGAEVSKEKLPILCQKNKLAYRNVFALRPCFACVTVSIIVRNISIPRLSCSGHPFHDNGVAARCTKLATHSGPSFLYKPQCVQMSRTAPWTIVVTSWKMLER